MSITQDIANHPAYISKLRAFGGEVMSEQAKSTSIEPPVYAGLFDYPEWEAGKAYEANELFMYDGQIGFVRQAHTSQETWIPFTAGTEALYGARPRMKPDGTYPYVYNMLIKPDMLIWSAKDSKLYRCVLSAQYTLLYDPADAVGVCEPVSK